MVQNPLDDLIAEINTEINKPKGKKRLKELDIPWGCAMKCGLKYVGCRLGGGSRRQCAVKLIDCLVDCAKKKQNLASLGSK